MHEWVSLCVIFNDQTWIFTLVWSTWPQEYAFEVKGLVLFFSQYRGGQTNILLSLSILLINEKNFMQL